MYAPKRDEVEQITERVFKRAFKKLNLEVEQVVLRDFVIPEEAKILMNLLWKLEMNYYEVFLFVDGRIKEINGILETDKVLSKKEKSALKEELSALENHKYVREIYDKQILELLKQGLTITK